MAPILALLRSMAERAIDRPATYYYGARAKRDLCFDEELRALAETLAELPLRAGAVRAGRRRRVGRRGRSDHRRRRAGTRTDLDRRRRLRLRPAADGRGRDTRCWNGWASRTKRIYYDKFTTTGDAGDPEGAGGREPDDDHTGLPHRTERAEAGLHRCRGRRQGVPGLDGTSASTTTRRRSASRATTRTSPSRCSRIRGTTSARAGCTGSPTAAAATRWTGPR